MAFVIVFFGTIVKRKVKHIYVANWFYGGFIPLRFFATYAKWNDTAANAGPVACTGRDCNTAVTSFANKRSAVTYGAQVEAWF